MHLGFDFPTIDWSSATDTILNVAKAKIEADRLKREREAYERSIAPQPAPGTLPPSSVVNPQYYARPNYAPLMIGGAIALVALLVLRR